MQVSLYLHILTYLYILGKQEYIDEDNDTAEVLASKDHWRGMYTHPHIQVVCVLLYIYIYYMSINIIDLCIRIVYNGT